MRRAAAGALTALACVLVWFALVAPNRLSLLTPTAFVRIPVEGLILAGLVLVLPSRVKVAVAALAGVVLALVTIVKVLDMGFFEALGRPFNPVFDRGYFGSAAGLLGDSVGRRTAVLILIAAAVLVVGVLVGTPWAVLRLTRVVDRHRTTSIRAVAAVGLVWSMSAALGVQVAAHTPLVSRSALSLATAQVRQVQTSLRDERAFTKAAGVDALRDTSPGNLLTGLRGKDVIVAFVESYGRVALQDSAFSSRVDAVLDSGTKRLRAAGFSSKSAFLTSPTFGGISWLAHSTLQSGLWIDNPLRYDYLLASDRLTLTGAFHRAGWRTVDDVPSNTKSWPQGKAFYHYDKVYDARNVGYKGPKFSYATMPDQYILSAFQRQELAERHAPVMAEIDLVSSHTPWAPLPQMVDPNQVGDGSVFDGMPGRGQSAATVWRDRSQVQAAYGRSIEYSLNALISFVQTSEDDNLVLVVLGDHQPATIVSGEFASRDVPITVIAHDRAVMDRVSGWGWQDGMRPGPNAPVWPMDAFRDRFLTAYGPQSSPPPAPFVKH
ncbi:MAG: hypothetical protein M3Y44_14915 [Actinomycetota bacterium]|nr:hypothetical protein [Actinomycetota bacterium]